MVPDQVSPAWCRKMKWQKHQSQEILVRKIWGRQKNRWQKNGFLEMALFDAMPKVRHRLVFFLPRIFFLITPVGGRRGVCRIWGWQKNGWQK